MPVAPKRPCLHRGCTAYAEVKGYCSEHYKSLRKYWDAQRQNAGERGYDSHWQKFRLVYLRENPICTTCGKAANEVDHIIPLRTYKGGKYDEWNLQPLCHRCHSAKTMREMASGG